MEPSTANLPPSNSDSPEPESLDHSATRRWVGLRLLDNMILQRDEKAVLDESMQVTKWWNRFNMRGGDGANALPTGGEEMGDMIAGDQKIIHHHYPPAAPQKSKLGALAKLAIGAGLIGTGAGVMAGAPLIISALKDWKQPAAVAPTVDTDTDSTGELILWPPKK